MSDSERSESDEEFVVETSRVPAARAGTAPAPPSRSPLEPRHTPRQRIIRLVVTLATGFLVLAIILSTFPGVRSGVIGLIAGPTATPAFRFTPAETLFYLLPTPPGVDVTLDGHALASPPLPGDPHPLHLAQGSHVFAWVSHHFPFAPLRCTISVPRGDADTCPLRAVPTAGPGFAAIIAMHPSLAALPTNAATPLLNAFWDALAGSRSTATVEPGERYYYYHVGQAGSAGPVVATQALRATLTYFYLANAGYPEPCILGTPDIPCRFPGQDCSQLCTMPFPPSSVAPSPTDWIATAEVAALWDYATPDGHEVASGLGEAFGVQLLTFRITWDGAAWGVTPLFGHIAGLPASDDAVCDPARFWLGQGHWSFLLADPPPPGAQRPQFVSDATPTDGCLALLSQPGDPPAAFLERFGVLLAVNDLAESGGAKLPMADAAEERLARQLAAQAGITV
jgi:hypothetical protein